MLLDDSVVLLHMDNGESGCFIPVDAKHKDHLISLRRLTVLKAETEKLLCEMAKKLRSGDIEALPARNDDRHNACAFCDYRSVCGREDDGPEREIPSIRHAECLKLLEEKEAQTDAVDR
jgi:ATP-dependent helicase/nuclease subunit B